jgi:cold shock CspA family protein
MNFSSNHISKVPKKRHLSGVVKSYDPLAGYGYIIARFSKNIEVELPFSAGRKVLKRLGVNTLLKGQKVNFDAIPDPRNPSRRYMAVDLSLIEDSSVVPPRPDDHISIHSMQKSTFCD